MDNQYNFPEKNLPAGSTKRIVLFFISLAVLLVVIFAIFFAFNLGRREALSEKAITKQISDPASSTAKTASTASASSSSLSSHAAVGSEAIITSEEKKIIGVPDFVDIKALQRDSKGKILSFEVVPNPNDSIDSDGDGIPDKEEKILGTNPNNPDTDGDGVSDYQELIMGTDPKIANDFSKK
jgi:hypothetical protein